MTAVAALAVCAMAFAAAAQQERPVNTLKDNGDTVKINVSGRIQLDYVWRSRELTNFTASPWSNGAGPAAKSEDTFEGVAAVRLDAELSDKVAAVIEIGTLRVDPVGGLSPVDSGIHFMATEFGGAVGIREAHIALKELLMPELSAKIGIADWSFDVRGRGNSFAFDPRHSQSINRRMAGPNPFNANNEETAAYVMERADHPSEQYPVGGVISYAREAIKVDLVLLPGVVEFGAPENDETLYAIDLWYKLDQVGKGSQVGVIAAMSTLGPQGPFFFGDNPAHGTMWTVGLGVDLKNTGVEGLEIYGEVYKQFGVVAQTDLGTGREDIKANGMAFQIGGEYHLPGDLGLWLGINYTSVSGDGDDDPTDDKCDRFLSYENVNDLLIVEDMYFGLDIDRNYTAIKLSGGVALSVGNGKNNLELGVTVGICKTQEDVIADNGVDRVDKLGTEFDVRAKYHLSKQATLTAAFAMLSGSDVMEEATGGSADPDSEDKCSLYTLGIDVKF